MKGYIWTICLSLMLSGCISPPRLDETELIVLVMACQKNGGPKEVGFSEVEAIVKCKDGAIFIVPNVN